jgi:hypothetical protein
VDAVDRTLKRTLPDETLSETLPCRPAHIAVTRDGILCDIRQNVANASIARVVRELGGSDGSQYANALWLTRGWLDRALGGVGLQRSLGGAPLKSGDYFDFWYVQDLVPDRRLLLRPQMKVPGHAWLEFLLLLSRAAGRWFVAVLGLSPADYWESAGPNTWMKMPGGKWQCVASQATPIKM